MTVNIFVNDIFCLTGVDGYGIHSIALNKLFIFIRQVYTC